MRLWQLSKRATEECSRPGWHPHGLLRFYRVSWSEVGRYLTALLIAFPETGLLSPTKCQALFRLLPMTGRKDDIRNWRPILLQNTGSRIISQDLIQERSFPTWSILNGQASSRDRGSGRISSLCNCSSVSPPTRP
ncbi:hypothetical protein V1504DRAFT_265641 [Lipomyces starkeyi]